MEDNKPKGLIDPTNEGPKNPAVYFASWKSTEEGFVHYDKVNKTNIVIPLPFTFIPLAKAVCIKGYNEPKKTSYISNEVKDPKKDPFVIRAYNNVTKKSSIAFTGLWESISEAVKASDGAWTESIYAAAKDANGNLQIVNIQLNGSGITHWFDFIKANKIFGNAVTVKEFSNEKKGSNKYKAPVFSITKISESTSIKAAPLQQEILAFLEEYWAKNKADESAANTAKPEQAKSEPSKAQPAANKKLEENTNFTNEANEVANDIISNMASDEEPF